MSDNLIDYSDIQGLVRYSHAHLTEACFLLLQVDNAAAARSWLGKLPVTTAQAHSPLPTTALQLAFTAQGLKALEVADDILRQFAPEFVEGMAGVDSRSRRLGDVDTNSPRNWLWGWEETVPHVLLMLYALPGQLNERAEALLGQLPQAGLSLVQHLSTAISDGLEPFGFSDGISQPELDWSLQRRPGEKDQLTYGNRVALGEFLLGYPNEYGKLTERPLVARSSAPGLPPAPDRPDKVDLGRNGTYLVFRHLTQDVRRFWQFVDQQAHGDPAAREALAAALVGRQRDGTPLVNPDAPTGNDFTFDGDPDGTRCPLGAHIRRANPRTADLPGGAQGFVSHLLRTLGFCRTSLRTDAVASVRFHRLLRRGRKYGPGLTPEQALQSTVHEGQERGLYFISLGANISRQFEFVQNAWMIGTNFDGLSGENDPLLGNRRTLSGQPTDSFTLPQPDSIRREIKGLPQFVTVRGGAYFFLPGIRALRCIGL